MLMHYFQALLFVVALSIDAFAACFVCGASRVRIPASSLFILSAVSAGTLLLSLLLGNGIGSFLSPGAASAFSFLVLFSLGFLKLFDSALKGLIRKKPFSPRKLRFSLLDLQFILTVYADPVQVNQEDKSVLSPREALPLGLALSLDSAAAGIGGASSLPLLATGGFALLSSLLAVSAGSLLGRRLSNRISLDLSWLCGLLLMGLALLKL